MRAGKRCGGPEVGEAGADRPFDAAGIEAEASTPAELKAFQAAETSKWEKIVADAKIEKE